MLMTFSHLFIAFNHLSGKKFIWAPVCNSGFCYRSISSELIDGPDKMFRKV